LEERNAINSGKKLIEQEGQKKINLMRPMCLSPARYEENMLSELKEVGNYLRHRMEKHFVVLTKN